MMIKWTKYCLLLIFVSVFANGQSVGTTAFEFLRNQYSARGAAMANNLVAIQGDINAMLVNPAVLSTVVEPQWTLNYADHLLDFQAGQAAYALRSAKWGTVGFGLQYFDYGNFNETDEFGEQTGNSFGASEFAVSATLANQLAPGYDYGVSVKFIYSSLENFSASGIAFDGGLIYRPSFISDFQVGVSVSNVGFMLSSYTDKDESMPLLVRLGVAKKLAHLPLLFTVSLNDLSAQTGDNLDIIKRFSIGGEFDISEALKFRIGYDNGVNRSVKSLDTRSFSGLSAGLGVHYKQFRLDYAFVNYGELGTQNRLGITGGL
jgi:hypothetical protein